MRRWYIASAVFVSVSLVAVLGFTAMQAQEAKEPDKQAASKNAKSRIDKVTVYPHNALVTREVEVPAGNTLEHGVQPWALLPALRTADAGILEDLGDNPAVALRGLLKLPLLVLDGLAGGADAKVEGDAKGFVG